MELRNLSNSRRVQKAYSPSKRFQAYYITDRRQLIGEPLISAIRRILARGVDFIQIREKDLPDREIFKLTRRVVSLAKATGCRVLVNGRPDIALAAGAHGVHLPSNGFKLTDLRPWLPEKFIIGVSVHSIR